LEVIAMASDIVTGSVTQVARVAVAKAAAPERRTESSSDGKAKAAEAKQSREALQEAMVGLSELIQSQRRSLQFSVDATSGRTVIRVLDAETQEMIRQIPAEEVVNLSRWLKGSSGALFDANA
jgi:flagellar protein FlaG